METQRNQHRLNWMPISQRSNEFALTWFKTNFSLNEFDSIDQICVDLSVYGGVYLVDIGNLNRGHFYLNGIDMAWATITRSKKVDLPCDCL